MLSHNSFEKEKSARRDSNPRPSPWQGDTPPLSHLRMMYCFLQARNIITYEMDSVNYFFKKTAFLYFGGQKTERQSEEAFLCGVAPCGPSGIDSSS